MTAFADGRGLRDEDFTGTTSDHVPPAEDEGSFIYHHVSLRHLQRVLSWFNRSLVKERWSELDLVDRRYEMLAHDWDEDAFLVLLNVIHLRHRRVPRTVPLGMLAEVAVLIDYYECGEAIELFTQMWIDNIRRNAMPSTCCRDMILWIWSHRFSTSQNKSKLLLRWP